MQKSTLVIWVKKYCNSVAALKNNCIIIQASRESNKSILILKIFLTLRSTKKKSTLNLILLSLLINYENIARYVEGPEGMCIHTEALGNINSPLFRGFHYP